MVLVTWFAAVLVSSPVAADEAERVSLGGSHSEQQFVAGEDVHIDATVTDEVFAAGGAVTFDGASAKTIIAAGHRLTVQGSNADDVILAGGGLSFDGTVADDLVAAICPFCPFSSNRLHVESGATIGDDARLAAGILDIDGTIGGDLQAAAGEFTLTGEIAGDAEIVAKRIALGPGARIGGDLRYYSETEPDIADGAVIGGTIAELDEEWLDEIDFERDRGGFWSWLMLVLSLVVFGVVVRLVAPGLVTATATLARERTLSSLGIGFLVLVVTPIAAGLLLVSFIGAPLGIFALILLLVVVGLALTTIALAIGDRLRRFARGAAEAPTTIVTLLWLAVGMIVLAIIGAIPFLGGLIILIALLVGLGAVCRRMFSLLRSPAATAP